jgi:hypothetical protein
LFSPLQKGQKWQKHFNSDKQLHKNRPNGNPEKDRTRSKINGKKACPIIFRFGIFSALFALKNSLQFLIHKKESII